MSQPGGSGVPLRPFGATGEQVSLLAVGGAHIGGGKLAEEDSIRLIDRKSVV